MPLIDLGDLKCPILSKEKRTLVGVDLAWDIKNFEVVLGFGLTYAGTHKRDVLSLDAEAK